MTTEKIDKERLLEYMSSGEVTVLNVLAADDYRRLHIRGSVSAPLEELTGGGWKNLDRGTKYVTHCSGPKCTACEKAAEFLLEKGFTVSVYRGGIQEWSESGLPVEGEQTYSDYEKTPRL